MYGFVFVETMKSYALLFLFLLSLDFNKVATLLIAAASSLGSAVGCRVEDRAIDTALGQCFIPNSTH